MGILNDNTLIGASAAGGYDIPNSLRFNDDDSSYLSRTPSVAGNRKTWTWSGWVKTCLGGDPTIFGAGDITTRPSTELALYNTGNASRLAFLSYNGAAYDFRFTTDASFRDPSAWYHIILAFDSTQATASNRVKVYVNGTQVTVFSYETYPALNFDGGVSNNVRQVISTHAYNASGSHFDGYLSEVNFIDGQALTPDSFGETGDYGEWIPKKYVGTYGTNGFYLDFADSGTLGNDASPNSNNWTPTNLAATDQMLDSPTNNFAVLNPLFKTFNANPTLSEGNTKTASNVVDYQTSISTIGASSGLLYFEALCLGTPNSANYFGISNETEVDSLSSISTVTGNSANGYSIEPIDGDKRHNGISEAYGSALANTDILQVAINLDTGKLWFGKNGTWFAAGVPASGTGEAYSGLVGTFRASLTMYSGGFAAVVANFGQDSSFAGNKTAQGNTDANGIGDFYYAPPTGFLALCTKNLPDATVVPSEHFNTVLWTGNGVATDIPTGIDSDLVWIKSRSALGSSTLLDNVRIIGGAYYGLSSNTTDAESSNPWVDDVGTVIGLTGGGYNSSGVTYCVWNWKAGGTGVSNTDGTITSTVSANVDAGFSIVSYTGTGSNATVGHGLSEAPDMVIVKSRDTANSWNTWHDALAATDYVTLNTTTAAQTYAPLWNSTAPTSSVFSLGTDQGGNKSGGAFITYAFHSVDGYSKVGSYTGNGSADGTFVYTGFRPAYVMVKRTDGGTTGWIVWDSVRDTSNVNDTILQAHSSAAEVTAVDMDMTSNGFKFRTTDGAANIVSGTYIYIAFAESPFKHSNAR